MFINDLKNFHNYLLRVHYNEICKAEKQQTGNKSNSEQTHLVGAKRGKVSASASDW